MCVFGCSVLAKPIHHQSISKWCIRRTPTVHYSRCKSWRTGHLKRYNGHQGTWTNFQHWPWPGLKSDSLVGVDLANMGAQFTQDVVAWAWVPSCLKDLVSKYCMAMCEIPVERIVPGNNLCLVRLLGVKVIQDAIQNSGWDESSIFITSAISNWWWTFLQTWRG